MLQSFPQHHLQKNMWTCYLSFKNGFEVKRLKRIKKVSGEKTESAYNVLLL